MNCKQGDLAIIVKSNCGNEGKILTCVKFIGSHFLYPELSDLWETDIELNSYYLYDKSNAPKDRLIPDSQLRPLLGDLINDETTTSKELEAA